MVRAQVAKDNSANMTRNLTRKCKMNMTGALDFRHSRTYHTGLDDISGTIFLIYSNANAAKKSDLKRTLDPMVNETGKLTL